MLIHPRLDKAEKRFLGVCLLALALFLWALQWWGAVNQLPEVNIPTPALPALNAFDDYTRAATLLVPSPPRQPISPVFDTQEVPRKEWPQKYPLQRKKAWLNKNAPALKIFRQGLQHTYQAPPARSFTTMFPYYVRFRELARVLSVESEVHAARGNWKDAAQSAADIVQFGHQIPRGSSLSGALMGHAIHIRGQFQLQDTVSHLDAATCRKQAQRLTQMNAQRVHFWQVLEEEKWSMQAGLLEAMRHRDWATILGLTGTAPNSWEQWRHRFTPKQKIMSDYSRYMEALVASAKIPYAKAPGVPLPSGIVGQTLAPAMESMRFDDARASTGTRLLATALALRAYKLERGIYPEKLTQLVPDYLLQLPGDGFGAGEALRYQKQGAAYLLWSIGPDKKDDRGVAITGARLRSSEYGTEAEVRVEATSRGDWVYGKNR